ncbi:MAG: Ribonuclease E [uncultured Sphingomonas sp.]|uniref:Ribonuclease E n=1 Tax=uncultured Sphingomonas sp. TaxID=158754 RepID=A0A6J4SW08_9SPHN|nr:MAG: Ribonuclease E [uncultured Sphingomonas sp.]
MSMRMLIDARHPEETRVAVVKGNRIEEFDFESAEHKQLKGNIYLAKVTRVEPSLQAAFIDYGGNRHGFLAFSEIHPDYYQIPKADREALLREEAEHAAEEERLRSAEIDDDYEDGGSSADDEPDDGGEPELTEAASTTTEIGTASNRSPVDESAADELRRKRQDLRRRYKIQDVIQRRQVLLVQVVKEERGNKGAAITTYLSLAGRYCVLMPNTSHGGGISRKISNGADRKRLKSIMSDLNLPSVMGLIVRTAGLSRTKTEIKRDFDYLARLWDEIRERTLGSTAPALIYRDSDLIKRAIRDLYHREIEEVIVEGEDGYKAARGFMKLLMPSHVRRVQLHSESTPLFQRSGVEDQLSAMYQPVVQLKSGGYLVINPTEALVSIDINSGRSTREHNIEQTAFATNLEAATEIARQLRLRDMAGLVVIDFIDMEQSGHVRKIEKAMKEALKNDRARIQVGRISSFGLMEMSRQRLRTGVLEASTKTCPHCEGTGLMRTASSAGLSALRMIEDEAARGRGEKICLRAGREAAVYVLNKKRGELADIEQRYGVSVEVMIDESFEGARMAVESSGPRPVAVPRPQVTLVEEPEELLDDLTEEEEDEEDTVEISLDQGEEPEAGEQSGEGDGHGRRRRRRRRGGRGRSRRDGEPAYAEAAPEQTEQPEQGGQPEQVKVAEQPEQAEDTEQPAEDTSRRRRRRGGRRAEPEAPEAAEAHVEPASSPMVERPIEDEPPIAETQPLEEPKPKRRRTKKAADEAPAIAPEPSPTDAPPAETVDQAAPPAKPVRKRRTKAAASEPAPAPEQVADEAEVTPEKPAAEPVPVPVPAANNDTAPSEPPAAPRRGWWQKTFG